MEIKRSICDFYLLKKYPFEIYLLARLRQIWIMENLIVEIISMIDSSKRNNKRNYKKYSNCFNK